MVILDTYFNIGLTVLTASRNHLELSSVSYKIFVHYIISTSITPIEKLIEKHGES